MFFIYKEDRNGTPISMAPNRAPYAGLALAVTDPFLQMNREGLDT